MKTKLTYITALSSCAIILCAAPPPTPPPAGAFGAEPGPPPAIEPGVPAVPPAPEVDAFPPLHLLAQAAVAPRPIKGADVFFSSGRGGRTLIIQSSDPDPKTYANLEEDLNVMYRILSKTRKQDDNGFKLESIFQGSSSSVKSMYIEGYGAVFMLGVRFPLVAPQTPEEQPKPKDTTSEEWDRARKELYSPRNTFELDLDHVWNKAMISQAEEYDSQKVEELTVGILESLKNGTHIRNLKSDEFITVAVLGAPSGAVRTVIENDDGGNPKRKTRVENVRGGSGVGESTMTLRAKKSDIDDFAKGKLNLDAFRKKVKMLVYLRPLDSVGKMAIFPAPGPGPAPARRP